jgi:hypothetical protein
MGRNGRHQPATKRQRKLIRARARGESLADAAIKAGYRCKDRVSAESVARTTLRRLTGRPELRQALTKLGMDLEWAAERLLELANLETVTEIRDGNGKVLRVIVRRDGRWRWHVLRIVMQAFEALADGEEPSPWDAVPDEELAAIVEGIGPAGPTSPDKP